MPVACLTGGHRGRNLSCVASLAFVAPCPQAARMNWFALSATERRRRPLRTGISIAGVAIAVAALFSLLAFHQGYRDGMQREIDRLGAHVLVVPKGCPYDAA